MININLLPKFQSLSLRWVMFMIISFLIIILLHKQWQANLFEKQHKITLLKKEVQAINAELLNSQHQRPITLFPHNPHHTDLLMLLKKLSYNIPVGLYLTDLNMTKNNLKLIGYAEKTGLISVWIATLTAAHFTVSLQEIMGNKAMDDFTVKFCLRMTCPST
jgi:Tfp pilus assembly protein PilN